MILEVTFSQENKLIDAELSASDTVFKADFGQVQVVTEYIGGKPYEGDYAVTPKVEEQTLPTKEKVMAEDLTIKAIPIFRTSNTSGGTTVYIAKEV